MPFFFKPISGPFTRAAALAGAALFSLLIAGCGRSAPAGDPAPPGDGSGEVSPSSTLADRRSVVLYSSADSELVKLVAENFEKDYGIRVLWTGDTEQTKTTGLVQRMLDEKDRPRADVWWSSEPFGTIRLAREGLFEPYVSQKTEESVKDGWPAGLKSPENLWYGFARRSRVLVYNPDKVGLGQLPRTLDSLADPRFKGRVGLARPQFGTTGGQMAAICAVYGPDALRDWLRALKANDVKLYDGNMSVVRAVSTGEIFVGLADADDVWAGERNKWPVELLYEPNDLAASPLSSFKGWGKIESLSLGAGPLLLPNTVALVKREGRSKDAERFIDYLLSERVERLLAESESHNIPTRDKLLAMRRFAEYSKPVNSLQPMSIDLQTAADQMETALKICREELGE